MTSLLDAPLDVFHHVWQSVTAHPAAYGLLAFGVVGIYAALWMVSRHDSND